MQDTETGHSEDIKKGLLSQLNGIKVRIYGDDCHPITMKQLNYHAYSKNNPKRYIQFQIPKKKKGEFRTITAPNAGLKCIQRCINAILLERFEANPAANGFVPGKSIVDNARVHLGQKYIYNIDLKDFFPSVTIGRVFACLQLSPFSFDKQTASLIADLCCHEGVLPQGAPTSPTLTNIVCSRLDWRLSKLARRYGLRYSRYADDITFSGMSNIFHEDGDFVKELRHFIEKEGFRINEAKTRVNSYYQRQEVTGLTINEKPNVTQRYVKQIRTMLHNWEASGYEAAQSVFLKHYHPTKNVAGEHHIENILSGKLDYLKMVKGKKDSTYGILNGRFEKLVRGTEADIDLSQIIYVWEQKGLDAARKAYEKKTNESQIDAELFVNKLCNAPSLTSEAKKKIISLLVQTNMSKKTTAQQLAHEKKKQDLVKENPGLYHDPEFVSRFLHQFTEKECQALKFTTHYWDEDSESGEYNYKSFDDLKNGENGYRKILESGFKTLDSYKALYSDVLRKTAYQRQYVPSLMNILHFRCEHLWKIINNFLLVDDPNKDNEQWKYQWGEHKLRIGYNQYLKNWMDENPQQQPFAMPLSYLPSELIPKTLINGKQLNDFGSVVELFKHCIEFRDDDLFKAVKKIFKSSDIVVNKELLNTLKGTTFFTDTSLVKEALRIIAGNIFHRSEHPNVEIRCYSEMEANKKRITLEVLQVDSYSHRDVTDAKINPNSTEGDLATIKTKLRNLCDFSIESQFKVSGILRPLRINYLTSNYNQYKEREEITEKECRGFKYLLHFYNYITSNVV